MTIHKDKFSYFNQSIVVSFCNVYNKKLIGRYESGFSQKLPVAQSFMESSEMEIAAVLYKLISHKDKEGNHYCKRKPDYYEISLFSCHRDVD